MGGHNHLNSVEVQEHIDAIGFGPFQLVMLTMCGGLMFAEGSEVLVMGTITTLLKGHWELSALLRGTMVAIVFIGFAVGNLLSGFVGDRYGRRPAILAGYALIGVFGFLTGLAWNPAMMVGLRFCVGVGCGIGFPSVYSMIPEVCPTHLRGAISTLMIGFMPLGELYAALLVLLVDPALSHSQGHCEAYGHYPNLIYPTECTWRTMCELSALPAFCFLGAASACLWESPHYLAAQGKEQKACEVLRAMARMNGSSVQISFSGAMDASTSGGAAADGGEAAGGQLPHGKTAGAVLQDDTHHEYSFKRAVQQLLSPPLSRTTLFMCYAHFCKDFSVFGLSYVLPQFFHHLETYSVGVHLLMMSVLAIPGVLLAFAFTRATFIGHIPSMRAASMMTAVFTIGMLEFASAWSGAPCAFLAKSTAMAYFICTVVYTAEVFPTNFRNTAVGLCTCFGRAGSISAPLIFELSHEHAEGSFDIFLGLLIALMIVVSTSAGHVLTIETKGRQLQDEETDELVASPLSGHHDGLHGGYGAAELPKKNSAPL